MNPANTNLLSSSTKRRSGALTASTRYQPLRSSRDLLYQRAVQSLIKIQDGLGIGSSRSDQSDGSSEARLHAGRKLDGFGMDDDDEYWLTSKIKKRPGEVRQVMVYIDI